MKDKDQRLLWESYSAHRAKITESTWDERQPDRDKFNDPGHRQLQQKMQGDYERAKTSADDEGESNMAQSISDDRWGDEVDLNAGMKDLISDNSDLVGDFYKVYDSRNPDHVEAHDEIVRSLWNTYNLLDQSVRQFVGETKSKQPTGEEGPTPGSQEHFDQMDVDDPNHWQNSGGRPPGY